MTNDPCHIHVHIHGLPTINLTPLENKVSTLTDAVTALNTSVTDALARVASDVTHFQELLAAAAEAQADAVAAQAANDQAAIDAANATATQALADAQAAADALAAATADDGTATTAITAAVDALNALDPDPTNP